MNTLQINEALKNHPYFRGTYAANTLPPVWEYPSCYVVNTQTANLPGEHWLALWIGHTRIGEVFDPLGMMPPTRVQLWMNKNCRQWTYNQTMYQNPLTNLCGEYCIIFLHKRLEIE